MEMDQIYEKGLENAFLTDKQNTADLNTYLEVILGHGKHCCKIQ